MVLEEVVEGSSMIGGEVEGARMVEDRKEWVSVVAWAAVPIRCTVLH